MRFFIVNSKNYLEAAGEDAHALGECHRLDDKGREITQKVKIVLAVPLFRLQDFLRNLGRLDFFCQHLDDREVGSTTGFLIPEIAKSFGARGSFINHSEHRVPPETISHLVERLRRLGVVSVVCARDGKEVSEFAEYEPDYIAIEPPELIGSGRAVSKTKPELIVDSKKELDAVVDRLKSRTKLLCGAGIIDPVDATKAIELGSEGYTGGQWNNQVSRLEGFNSGSYKRYHRRRRKTMRKITENSKRIGEVAK